MQLKMRTVDSLFAFGDAITQQPVLGSLQNLVGHDVQAPRYKGCLEYALLLEVIDRHYTGCISAFKT